MAQSEPLTSPSASLSPCGDCAFFVPEDIGAEPPPIKTIGDGRCHRYPPRFELKDEQTTMPSLYGVWPPVAAQGFRSGCGEFVSVKTKPAKGRHAKGKTR